MGCALKIADVVPFNSLNFDTTRFSGAVSILELPRQMLKHNIVKYEPSSSQVSPRPVRVSNMNLVLPGSLRSSVDRAPTRCSGGHRFDSCRGLRIFSLSHARDMLIITSFRNFKPLSRAVRIFPESADISAIQRTIFLHLD